MGYSKKLSLSRPLKKGLIWVEPPKKMLKKVGYTKNSTYLSDGPAISLMYIRGWGSLFLFQRFSMDGLELARITLWVWPMNSLMWPWPERMVSWLRPTRLTCFAVVTNEHPPPISYQESLTKAGQWVTDKAKQWSHFNPINQMPAINITSSSSSPFIYCAEGGHWIFE